MPKDDDIEIRVILKDELSGPAENVQRSYREMAAGADDASESTDKLSGAQDKNTESMDRSTKSVNANRQARDEHGKFIRVNTDLTVSHTAAVGGSSKAADKNSRAIKKMGFSFKNMGKLMLPLKVMGVADALGVATAGAGALGGAAFAAVAGLAPLTGAMLPLPGLLAGAGMGAITAKMAFGGLGKAAAALGEGDWKAFAEATKDMGPNAVEAAKGLNQMTQAFKPIKGIVQEKVLDGMGDSFRDIGEKYAPMVTDAFSKAADGMHDVISNALGWATLNETMERTSKILDDSTKMSTLFGHAGMGAFRSLHGLMAATGDTGVRMAQDISDAMNKLGDVISGNQDRIGGFADRGYTLLLRMGGVLGDMGKALFNTGKLAMGLAGDMGLGFEGLMRKWKDWTASVEGQNAIKTFFDSLKPSLEAAGRLLEALWTALSNVGKANMGSLPGTIDKITEMVPALEGIITASSGTIDTILEIAGAILKVVDAGNMLGPFAVVLGIIGPIIEGIGNAFMSLPGPIQEAIGMLATIALTANSLSEGGMMSFLDQFGLMDMLIDKVKQGFMALGPVIMRSIVWPFVGFMLTNPIGWIILAVVALIGIFVLLWFKCEAFRNIVKAIGQWFVDVWNNVLFPTIMKVWEWIKVAWDKVWEIVSGVVNKIVSWFKDNWDTISAVIGVFVTIVKTYFTIMWTIVSTYVKLWWTVFKFAFTLIWNIVKTVVMAIINYWKFMWGIVSAVAGPVINALIGIFQAWWGVVKSIVMLVYQIFRVIFLAIAIVVKIVILAIVETIKAIWNVVKWVADLVMTYWKWLWSIVVAVVTTVVNVIKAIIGFLWPYIQTGLEFIRMRWDTVWNFISGIVSGAIDFVKGVIGGIVDFVGPKLDTVGSIWSTVWETISNFVGGIIDKVKGFIQGIVDWMTPIIEGMGRVWETVWGGIRDFVMGIIEKIQTGIDAITGVVSSIGDGLGKVLDFLPGLFTGGSVTVGMKAMVGELGPEAFVSNSGKITGIGMNGPEVMRFPTAGYVVPNHVLHGANDPSVPNRIMGKLNDARGDGGYETGTAKRSSRAESNQSYMEDNGAPTSVTVQVMGNVTENVQIETAVRKALAAADRNRRERR